MAEPPHWSEDGPRVVHHMPPQGAGKTPCCSMLPFELPRHHSMTEDNTRVTCKGEDEPARMNSIVARRTSLEGRAAGALGRLLGVRALLNRASPDSIDAELRRKLLELIDRGYTHA